MNILKIFQLENENDKSPEITYYIYSDLVITFSVMGVTTSFPESKLSQDEISRLSKRFKKLDTDKSGTLCLKELLDLPQISQNPLAQRIVGKNNDSFFMIWKVFIVSRCS